MDHARKKIVKKTSSIMVRTNQDKIPLVPCNLLSDPIPEEDRRLLNWRRWVDEHQSYQKRLATKFKRHPMELVINAHESARAKKETQHLIETALTVNKPLQIKLNQDSVISETLEPVLVKSRDDDHKEYHKDILVNNVSRKTTAEMTRVALPNYILQEKKLLDPYIDPHKGNLFSKWDRGDYLRKRLTELKKDMEVIEPNKPDLDELIIVGRNMKSKKSKTFVRVPVITITSDNKTKMLSNPDDRIALKINRREFVREKDCYFEKLTCSETLRLRESMEDLNTKLYAYSVFDTNHVYKIISKKLKPISWSMAFVTVGEEFCKKKFVLENKGIQTLMIDWRNATPKAPIPIRDRVQSLFYFNKNPVIILPGQVAEVLIWFHTKEPIVASETWNLIVEPKIYPGTLSLRLWGNGMGSGIKGREEKNRASIKNQLSHSVGLAIVTDIVETILFVSTSERLRKEIPYTRLFLEGDLFEARNPSYFYKSTLVAELKCMYKAATGKVDWGLILKELHKILLSLEDAKLRNQMVVRFNEICNESLRPNVPIYRNPGCRKRQLVYWLLCVFFNRFEDESRYIYGKCSEPTSDDDYEGEGVFGDEEDLSVAESNAKLNIALYYETFYIRIYSMMCESIDRICAASDSQLAI